MAFLGLPLSLWHKVWAWLHKLKFFKLIFVEQITRLCKEVLEEGIHMSTMLHRGAATAASVCLRQYSSMLVLNIFHSHCNLQRWKSSQCKCRALSMRIQTLEGPVLCIRHSNQAALKTTGGHWSQKPPNDHDSTVFYKLFPTKQVFSWAKQLILHEGAGFTSIKNFRHKTILKPKTFMLFGIVDLMSNCAWKQTQALRLVLETELWKRQQYPKTSLLSLILK